MRAVLYARCSTEEESQKDALKKQVQEARDSIKRKGWTLVDAYVESRSGTTRKGREEYNRLVEDLSRGGFDVVVVKSQDRLMRNAGEWYRFLEKLSAGGKRLYLYLENQFYTPDDALTAGIKAILAEEYSRELSKKINNAHRRRQEEGRAVVLTGNAYGFRRLPDKGIALVEEEAEVKRRMYALCATGYGCRAIASILEDEGVRNRRGRPFASSDVLRMLRSPLNKGTVVMNRTHYDFQSKKTVKNPREQQFVYEGLIPATVSTELWEEANRQITLRFGMAKVYGAEGKTSEIEEKPFEAGGKPPGRHPLSGKLFCGLCGEPYYRKSRSRGGIRVYEWKCRRYLEHGRGKADGEGDDFSKKGKGCANIHLEERALLGLLCSSDACGQQRQGEYPAEKGFAGGAAGLPKASLEKFFLLLKKALDGAETKEGELLERERIRRWEERLELLLEKLLSGVIDDGTYQRKREELLGLIEESKRRLCPGDGGEGERRETLRRLEEIRKYLSGEGLSRLAVEACLSRVEMIQVFPEYLEVHLEESFFRIPCGSCFSYRKRQQEGREEILALMEENQEITAREIAGRLGIGLSAANYRIRVLKDEGKIRFFGAGGRGYWKVFKE